MLKQRYASNPTVGCGGQVTRGIALPMGRIAGLLAEALATWKRWQNMELLKRRPLKEKGAKANFEDTRAPNMKNCTQTNRGKNIQWFLTKLILWRFCSFPSCFTVSQRVSLTMPVETHTSIAGPKIRLGRVPPKSLILIGFSIMSHPFWGTPIFGNTHIYIYICIPILGCPPSQ